MHISIDLDQLSDDEQYRTYTFLKLKFDVVERKKIWQMDLHHILVRQEIDTRIINLLKSRRINTIQELSACQRSALERINGMGPRGMQQICRLLHHYGMELGEE
jgi:DNA-directed RNA polymerase alpha subunit